MSEFNWIDVDVYKWWVGSHHYRQLRGFDGYTLPQPMPATLPFLPKIYHEVQDKMNPYLAVWVFKRYLAGRRVVVEPMCGVGGTAV